MADIPPPVSSTNNKNNSTTTTYPTQDTGAIRFIALSPFSDSHKDEAFAMILDETKRVTIGHLSSSSASSLQVTKSFPLNASARSAAWAPFISSQLDQTGDDIHCIVTATVGCPIQLRYFSHISDKEKYPDVDPHDPSWVEGTYKCYDDLDYLVSANAVCWHKSRKGQLVCGYDKGYLGVFDVERPGRDLAWRQQVNSICAFQNNTSHNRKVTDPQHAVSAVAVHETRPDLIACGTRSGFLPIWDSRTKLPASVLRCGGTENTSSSSFSGGHALTAGITSIKFDPNCEYSVYSISRGKGILNKQKNEYQTGVVRHDLRMPQVAAGMMVTSSFSSLSPNSVEAASMSTMQPIHFDFVTSSSLREKLVAANLFASSALNNNNNNNNTLNILAGSPCGSKIVLGNCDNSSTNFSSPSLHEQHTNLPTTAVAVCNQRNIVIAGGGKRNFSEPNEDDEDLGRMEVGKIRPRDLPKQKSSNFLRVVR